MIMLDQIKVAAPCRQSWDEMDGDSQARFCQSCRQNVYNISEMTRAESEALIREKEGRLCVRFYRRTDGTVMTRDCPVGLRAVRLRAAAAFSGLVTLLFGGVRAAAGPPVLMGKPKMPATAKHSATIPQATTGMVALPSRTSEHHTSSPQKSTPPTMGKISLGSPAPKKHILPPNTNGHKVSRKPVR